MIICISYLVIEYHHSSNRIVSNLTLSSLNDIPYIPNKKIKHKSIPGN